MPFQFFFINGDDCLYDDGITKKLSSCKCLTARYTSMIPWQLSLDKIYITRMCL